MEEYIVDTTANDLHSDYAPGCMPGVCDPENCSPYFCKPDFDCYPDYI